MPNHQTRTVILKLWTIFVPAITALAYCLPAESVWGVAAITVFPAWLGLPLIALAAATLHPTVNRAVQRAARRVWHTLPGTSHPQQWAIGLSILSIPVFWLGRIRHLGWGDAAVLVAGLSFKDAPVIYNWQAPLTVFFHQRLWALLADPLFGWGVDTVYALVSVTAGGAFVFVSMQLARTLGHSLPERLAVPILLLTTGTIQLFFGYVENYTLIALGIAVFLWLGLKVLDGTAPLWVAIAALSVTNALHPSTVALWPAALVLIWQRFRRDEGRDTLWQETLLPPLFVSSATLTLMELGNHGLTAFLGDDRPGGGDHIWFVPLKLDAPTEWLHYSMFSVAHLADWGNELVLISVFGGAIVLLAVVCGLLRADFRAEIGTRATIGWFLGLAAGGYLLFIWAWNADYGIQKDWDLFSPAAIPLSALAAWLLPRLFPSKQAQAYWLVVIAAVSGLHTAAWVLSNAHVIW